MKTNLLTAALFALTAITSFAADAVFPASFETKYVKSGEALLQVRVVGNEAPILLVPGKDSYRHITGPVRGG